MPKGRHALLALLLRHYPLVLVSAFALWLGFGLLDLAVAQAPYDDVKTAEGWAWARIKQGDVADFNQHCGTPPLDPKDEGDKSWWDDCRKICSRFLEDLLTRAPWREQVPSAGVRVKGARIVENADFENARLIRSIMIIDSRIEGTINLRRARTESLIVIAGSLMIGDFTADGLHSESDLFLRDGTVFRNAVRINSARIDGDVGISDANVGGLLSAALLQVAGTLHLRPELKNNTSFNDVDLSGAKIAGQISLTGASFNGRLNLASVQVSGSLHMRSEGPYKTSFTEVVLTGAKVNGQISMTGSSFGGTLIAAALQVGESLLMGSEFIGPNGQDRTTFRDVVLLGAKISGQISMTGASFDGTVDADDLLVGGSLLMRDARYTGPIIMVLVHIGGVLDLRGATLANLDLSGASVHSDFALGGPNATVWKGKNGEPGTLNLRNMHVGNLMDARDAWPTRGHLFLDGFTFDHLGGSEGETGPEMSNRGMGWWDNWARLDPDYTPTPYDQLATALTALGDRIAANEIRYRGRAREHETEMGLGWVWSGFLRWLASLRTFRVLYWVLGLFLAGAALLWLTVPAARAWDKGPLKGLLWCFGASLSRLLPVIEINKEFTEFFNDPKRERLNWLQSVLFSALAIVGWVLGAILIAAMSGLT